MNEKLIKANGKLIRYHGVVYRVLAFKLGNRVLADADPINSSDRINLVKTRSETGKALRNLVDLGLFV
jgi:hypothetical protein